jgi:predicted nucleic acid-binding Zn ribbon protein
MANYPTPSPHQFAQCAGLPLVAERPMTEEERKILKKEARTKGFFSILMWMLAPVALIGFLLQMMDMSTPTTDSQWQGFRYIMLIIFAAIAILVLMSFEWRRDSKEVSGDLKANYVLRFEGVLIESNELDNLQQALLIGQSFTEFPGRQVYQPPMLF